MTGLSRSMFVWVGVEAGGGDPHASQEIRIRPRISAGHPADVHPRVVGQTGMMKRWQDRCTLRFSVAVSSPASTVIT